MSEVEDVASLGKLFHNEITACMKECCKDEVCATGALKGRMIRA